MRPSNKGWLSEYLEFRKDALTELIGNRRDSHPEYALYRIIQPTGLMYGQSVGNLNHPDAASWNEKERMKVLDFEKKDIPYFFVLDKEGRILYATSGRYSVAKMDEVEKVLE